VGISGVGAHLESNDSNIFLPKVLLHRILKIFTSYQEILLEDDCVKKRFLHQTPAAAIFWASLPPSLGLAGSDFLGKSLWADYGGTME